MIHNPNDDEPDEAQQEQDRLLAQFMALTTSHTPIIKEHDVSARVWMVDLGAPCPARVVGRLRKHYPLSEAQATEVMKAAADWYATIYLGQNE